MKNFIKCFKLWRKNNSGNDSKQRKKCLALSCSEKIICL